MKNFLSKTIDFINSTYPISGFSTRLKDVVLINIFIVLFFWIFKPFNLELSSEWTHLVRLSFITLFITSFVFLLMPEIFKETFAPERWTVLKEFILGGFNCFLLASFYFLAGAFFVQHALTFADFWEIQISVISIGLLVGVLGVFVEQNRLLRKHLVQASEMNAQLSGIRNNTEFKIKNESSTIFLESESGNTRLQIGKDMLLMITSADNYVTLVENKSSVLKEHLLRNSLKAIEEILQDYQDFFRCHRTCIVNLSQIESVSGNSQGYKLKIAGINDDIPVARSKGRLFREKMNVLFAGVPT